MVITLTLCSASNAPPAEPLALFIYYAHLKDILHSLGLRVSGKKPYRDLIQHIHKHSVTSLQNKPNYLVKQQAEDDWGVAFKMLVVFQPTYLVIPCSCLP